MTEYDYRNIRYSAVTAARNMAKELHLEYPKAVTCIKPSGSLSKIMDCSEGIHTPIGKYIFNNINFSKHDPMVDSLLKAGYKVFDNPTDDMNVIITLPVEFDNIPFSKVEVERKDGTKEILEVNNESAIKQLERYKKVMLYYVDHNCSITVYYSKDEKEAIINWIYDNWDIYYGVSFLPRLSPTISAKDLGYAYLPQEVVDKETYYKYFNQLKEIDWEGTDSDEEIEDEGCSTGFCPTK